MAALFLVPGCGNNIPENIQIPEREQQINFIYADTFSADQKVKLEEWINFTSSTAQELLGEFPFDITYHFHRKDSAQDCVTFGHTARTDSTHAAHFYVDPTYSLEELKANWIAPHEISHLALPRLPKSNLWFYEGFATYMSRKVMIETGVLSVQQVDSINQSRIAAVKDKFETSGLLPAVADSLIADHSYPAVYWIGASFFDQADEKLRTAGKIPLVDVIKEFQACCHVSRMTMDEVIASFDQISESKILSDLYTYYTTTPCHELLNSY